jgi:hypothetical protein
MQGLQGGGGASVRWIKPSGLMGLTGGLWLSVVYLFIIIFFCNDSFLTTLLVDHIYQLFNIFYFINSNTNKNILKTITLKDLNFMLKIIFFFISFLKNNGINMNDFKLEDNAIDVER